MKLDFSALKTYLKEDNIQTYQMQCQIFYAQGALTQSTLWYEKGAVMLVGPELRMFGQEDLLDRFLTQLSPGITYFFGGVDTNLKPLIYEHFTDLDLSEDCTAYTLNPRDFTETPGDLDSLNLADAEFIDNHWDYQYEGSVGVFQTAILNYPSSAIRVDGQLAGWVLCYDANDDMVNLGSLRVLEPYRHQGYGRLLSASLIAKVFATGKIPLVHIYDSNLPSQNLARSLGFVPHNIKMFWGSGQKK